jgi:uncharacterized protein GlcG (DUF336 family)
MRLFHALPLAAACALLAAGCSDGPTDPSVQVGNKPSFFPDHDTIRGALQQILTEQNGGLGFQMWATILDRTGLVVDVVFSGVNNDDQWPGSRVISAQKANTANAFSLDGFALSSANLFAAVQPGGSLYGLQESNPVDPDVAYAGKFSDYGTTKDAMIGKRIGGINVFGGGLALYRPNGDLVGGIGLSGDTSCTDHIIAWKLRHALNLDNVPAGVADGNQDDNIIFSDDATIDGFEHARCIDLAGEGLNEPIAEDLPNTHPIGPGE